MTDIAAVNYAKQLAADHYSSAAAMLRMAGDTTNPPMPPVVQAVTGAAALILARAGVHADLAIFCARAAELGIDLRTPQEQKDARDRERVATGVDCAACGHPHASHMFYPGGSGPHPEVTAYQYAVCGQCVRGDRSIDPPGPCA